MEKSIVGIIQARMGSKRLPGKSILDLAGKPLLFRFIERVKRAETLTQVVLATTENNEDDILTQIAEGLGIDIFRGSENDLIDRYYQAAKNAKADLIVRLCADNPVVEPKEIDRIVRVHLKSGNDFSANTHNIDNNGYPDGLGAEVYNFALMERLRQITNDPRNREHPHSYVYEHRECFKTGTVECPAEFRRPELKLDVNTQQEYRFLKDIYDYLFPKKSDFHITDIIHWYDNVYRKH
ncbi:MAG: glycosyltransferase family protein [Candidatus Omnitrophica bacterium]|nr:glycosyltransferase family protein [Candidatus Omnitrophota bacterium]